MLSQQTSYNLLFTVHMGGSVITASYHNTCDLQTAAVGNTTFKT